MLYTCLQCITPVSKLQTRQQAYENHNFQRQSTVNIYQIINVDMFMFHILILTQISFDYHTNQFILHVLESDFFKYCINMSIERALY